MGTNKNNQFSLLKLIAELELKNRVKQDQSVRKGLSPDDTNGITEVIHDVIYDQNIVVDGNTYVINAAEVDKNSILLWLWSDGADEEKTIRITLKVDELDVNSSYWNEENG